MNSQDRNSLGRGLIKSAPRLKAQLTAFYRWLPTAIDNVREKHLELIFEGDRAIAVGTPFGRLLLEDEFVNRGNQLVVRVLFCQPPSLLRAHAKVVFAVELYEDLSAYFGQAEPSCEFELDHITDTWASRNVLRLAYELAIACTEPYEDIR